MNIISQTKEDWKWKVYKDYQQCILLGTYAPDCYYEA